MDVKGLNIKIQINTIQLSLHLQKLFVLGISLKASFLFPYLRALSLQL